MLASASVAGGECRPDQWLATRKRVPKLWCAFSANVADGYDVDAAIAAIGEYAAYCDGALELIATMARQVT